MCEVKESGIKDSIFRKDRIFFVTNTAIYNPAISSMTITPSLPYTLSGYLSSHTFCITYTLNNAAYLDSMLFNVSITDEYHETCISSIYINMANGDNCIVDTCNFTLSGTEYHYETSNNSYSEFRITGNIAPGLSNVVVYADNGSIISYDYTPSDGLVRWNFGIDHALLVHLAEIDTTICFTILGCIDSLFCRSVYCVPASDLLALINSKTQATVPQTNSSTNSGVNTEAFPYRLQPNPATQWVNIIGAENSVQKVSLMNLAGNTLLETKELHINLNKLVPGTYLVRIISTDNHYYYLKLVKE